MPKKLQGILWSADVSKLDLERDKSYIINQILSLGLMDELRWLFKTYPMAEIRRTFMEHPEKSYSNSAFNFCKNILLGLKEYNPPLDRYVRTLPRNIRY